MPVGLRNRGCPGAPELRSRVPALRVLAVGQQGAFRLDIFTHASETDCLLVEIKLRHYRISSYLSFAARRLSYEESANLPLLLGQSILKSFDLWLSSPSAKGKNTNRLPGPGLPDSTELEPSRMKISHRDTFSPLDSRGVSPLRWVIGMTRICCTHE